MFSLTYFQLAAVVAPEILDIRGLGEVIYLKEGEGKGPVLKMRFHNNHIVFTWTACTFILKWGGGGAGGGTSKAADGNIFGEWISATPPPSYSQGTATDKKE